MTRKMIVAFLLLASLMLVACGSDDDEQEELGTELEARIESLIVQISDEDEFLALSAADKLSQIGKTAIPSLLKALNLPNKGKRHFYAVQALVGIGEPAIPALMETRVNPNVDGKARDIATRALVTMGAITDPTLKPANKAILVSTSPANGGEIPTNGELIMTFDNSPESVTVNGTYAGGGGRTVTWKAHGLTAGQQANINIAWKSTDRSNGSQTIILNITAEDNEPPRIISSSVEHGTKNVDPKRLNNQGIKIEFNENVAGTIKLTLEDGTDVGWVGEVIGKNATLKPTKGKEIMDIETTYVIVGAVRDIVGHTTRINIVFVTKQGL